MTKKVAIPDDLADLLEKRRQQEGWPSLDAAAEKTIRAGLDEDGLPYSIQELRTLIEEADASGPAEPWDPKAFREEVLKAYAARKVS